MSEEEKQEETNQEEKWNQERQELDQNHSVERKQWTSEKGAMQGQLSQAQDNVQSLKSQLDTLKTEREQFKKLDPESADVPDVIARQERVIQELSDTKNELRTLQARASDIEKFEEARAAETQRKQTIDKICGPLDRDYGVKYRNDAKKMADDLVDSGQEKVEDKFDAYMLLERCYKKLADGDKKPSKKGVPTDNGRGGSTTKLTDPVKETTMAETISDFRKGTWAKIKAATNKE